MDMAAAEVEEELQQPLVLLLNPLFPSLEEALSKKFHFLKPWEKPSMPTHIFLAAHAQSVKAMLSQSLTPMDSATFSCLPNLKFIQTTSAGINHIDMGECRRRGIAIGSAGSIYSEDVADYAVGLLLDVVHRISSSDRDLRCGNWSRKEEYRLFGSKIRGKRVGIVGLGRIGLKIAKRLEAFGCSISYNSRSSKPFVPFPYIASVQDLAARSDIIIVSCALTDETHHVINRDVLLALGKEGIVINIGRGPLIDEKELVNCLVRGEIGGAGLDVFNEEPDVPMELFAMDNVVLSPHRAFCTAEGFSSLIELITSNLEAFFSNRPLLTPVEEDY